MAWLNVYDPITGDIETGNWSGYTLRQVIGSAQISNTGFTQCRVTFGCGTSEGAIIGTAYIGHAASSGDAYDFDGSQVQLKFSGTNSATISANGSVVSDTATFTIASGKNLVVAFWVGSAASDGLRRKGTISGYDYYYLNSGTSDAHTSDTSGYSPVGTSANTVFRVESFSPDGGGYYQVVMVD